MPALPTTIGSSGRDRGHGLLTRLNQNLCARTTGGSRNLGAVASIASRSGRSAGAGPVPGICPRVVCTSGCALGRGAITGSARSLPVAGRRISRASVISVLWVGGLRRNRALLTRLALCAGFGGFQGGFG